MTDFLWFIVFFGGGVALGILGKHLIKSRRKPATPPLINRPFRPVAPPPIPQHPRVSPRTARRTPEPVSMPTPAQADSLVIVPVLLPTFDDVKSIDDAPAEIFKGGGGDSGGAGASASWDASDNTSSSSDSSSSDSSSSDSSSSSSGGSDT